MAHSMDDGGGRRDGSGLMNFASGRVQDEPTTIINRMMLRFRPIAPKPAAGAESGSSPTRMVPKVRTKRKYVRVKAGEPTRKKKNDSSDKIAAGDDAAADLNLNQLPPTPENNTDENALQTGGGSADSSLLPLTDPAAAVETWVTAGEEGSTTGACMDVVGFPFRKKDLETDTCPAFVSSGGEDHDGHLVRWVNDAYREMVAAAGKVVVRLAVAEKLRPYLQCCPAFSCWVRVRFKDNSGIWLVMRVPCDVWRMEEEEGLFAWRLDSKVALKLGI